MKFLTEIDKQLFDLELKVSGLTIDEFIKRRKQRIKRLKDFRRKQNTKSQWRKLRPEMLKGIRKFHKSTRGKAFHRDLGRYLATKDFSTLSYESYELVKPLSSVLTHASIEFDYYFPIEDDYIDYFTFFDFLCEEVTTILKDVRVRTLNEDQIDFLYRIVETNALIKSFAKKSGKSEEEVDKLWGEIKQELKNSGRKETDKNFYAILVGTLKKRLKMD